MEILSGAAPSEYDLSCTESLHIFLNKTPDTIAESHTQKQHRELVICELAKLLDTFNIEQDDNAELVQRVHLVTFGSYRLGVNSASGDIDALCVGVKSVSRKEFFAQIMTLLGSHSKITKLVAVPNAFVPVIKLRLDGIDIDLVFANVKSLDLSETKNLRDADPVDVRCLNGSRVTDKLFYLIPNMDNFRVMLVLLKYWAKQRGIHSNVLGFLPGIAINLLCARVCQWYPNASPAYLVYKFFHIFGKLWQWPNPVVLHGSEIVSNVSGLQSWDPKLNPREKWDLMPVLTPAFPCTNSCYAVTTSGFRIIQSEFRRGLAILQSMYPSKKCEFNKVWAQLCAPSTFFQDYKIYITITLSADVEHLDVWKGVVVSKIRKLLVSLEQTYQSTKFHVHTVPKCANDTQEVYYIGVHSSAKIVLDIAKLVDAFKMDIDKTIAADKTPDMSVRVGAEFNHKKRKHL